jgi:hypothetical protein
MSSKINLQTCEYACKSSIFQDNQLIYLTKQEKKMNLAWGEFIEKMNALYGKNQDQKA